jgi:SsrA-binding protein
MAKKSGAKEQSGPPTVRNRRARFDYELIETFEAGLELVGAEVKSIWRGRANLTDAFCTVREGELWLTNSDVEPYEHATQFQPERRRDRKLLLHRREIDLIFRRSQEKGLTIIPTRLYFKNGKVKAEIALARGKKSYDKREQIAAKETRRETERMRTMRD